MDYFLFLNHKVSIITDVFFRFIQYRKNQLAMMFFFTQLEKSTKQGAARWLSTIPLGSFPIISNKTYVFTAHFYNNDNNNNNNNNSLTWSFGFDKLTIFWTSTELI